MPWRSTPAEFKREVVQQILKGEKTLAELSREFDISPTIVRNWKRRYESGAATAVRSNEDVVPASELQAAQAKIRELERRPEGRQVNTLVVETSPCGPGEVDERKGPSGRHRRRPVNVSNCPAVTVLSPIGASTGQWFSPPAASTVTGCLPVRRRAAGPPPDGDVDAAYPGRGLGQHAGVGTAATAGTRLMSEKVSV